MPWQYLQVYLPDEHTCRLGFLSFSDVSMEFSKISVSEMSSRCLLSHTCGHHDLDDRILPWASAGLYPMHPTRRYEQCSERCGEDCPTYRCDTHSLRFAHGKYISLEVTLSTDQSLSKAWEADQNSTNVQERKTSGPGKRRTASGHVTEHTRYISQRATPEYH